MKENSMPEGVRTVMYWVIGLGTVALLGLILLILFGNVKTSISFNPSQATFFNESMQFNSTGYSPTTVLSKLHLNPILTGVIITNSTNNSIVLTAANYTISGGTITSTVASEYANTVVNVSATVSYDSEVDQQTDYLINNYTASVTNTGKQFPVTGTIIGIALLLAILIGLLVYAIRKMMGSMSAGNGNFGRSKFEGSSSAELG